MIWLGNESNMVNLILDETIKFSELIAELKDMQKRIGDLTIISGNLIIKKGKNLNI